MGGFCVSSLGRGKAEMGTASMTPGTAVLSRLGPPHLGGHPPSEPWAPRDLRHFGACALCCRCHGRCRLAGGVGGEAQVESGLRAQPARGAPRPGLARPSPGRLLSSGSHTTEPARPLQSATGHLDAPSPPAPPRSGP